MASTNLAQLNQWYNHFIQYTAAAGMTYDSAQGKWVQNQNPLPPPTDQPNQNQPMFFQQLADYYSALARGMGQNAGYSQSVSFGQQDFNSGGFGSGFGMNFGTSLSSTNMNTTSGQGTFGSGTSGSFGNNAAQSFGTGMAQNFGSNTMGQIAGMGQTLGNSDTSQGFGSSNTAQNMMSANTSQSFGSTNNTQNVGSNNTVQNTGSNNTAQSFGNSDTSSMLQEYVNGNQSQNWQTAVIAQAFGASASAGQNFGNTNSMAGNTFGSNGAGTTTGAFGVLGSGLMNMVGASLYQNTGNLTMDGEGGYYAAPVDTAYQTMGGYTPRRGGKFKKKPASANTTPYSRFAGQNLFGGWGDMQGSQPQASHFKHKQLLPGARMNPNGETVIDVEIPIALFSRWGQLRKFYGKEDVAVARHLFEVHDIYCDECLAREEEKRLAKEARKHGSEHENDEAGSAKKSKPDDAEEVGNQEVTDEELEMQRLMGFSNFSTTKGGLEEEVICAETRPGTTADESGAGTTSQTDTTTTTEAKTSETDSSAADTTGPFIGPVHSSGDTVAQQMTAETGLTESEREMMKKLGWCVFNRKRVESVAEEDEDGDNNNDDNGDKDVGGEDDDGTKNQTAPSTEETGDDAGEWKLPPDDTS